MTNERGDRELVRRLVERRVIPDGSHASVQRLPGGVSADVIEIRFDGRRIVAKRALPQLRVAQQWRCSPERVLLEAAALDVARSIRPANVPAVLDVDDAQLVLVMAAAPPDGANWKLQLLSGVIDVALAASLGEALAEWHTKSVADKSVLSTFTKGGHFFELRIDPFFLRVAQVHPDLSGEIRGVVDRMTRRAMCLVHGDFSPKNVLVGSGWFWVLDWETAHIGDPTFDLAFLVSHLVLKAIRRPEDAEVYRDCSNAFLATYLGASGVALNQMDLVCQVGCLVLARVDGKSPVDYLDASGKTRARQLGRAVLSEGATDLAEIWSGLTSP
ncbi:MAG: phosphotransferase family protein [Acidimicrobiales bacterium]